MKITIVCEDDISHKNGDGFIAEHGSSMLLQGAAVTLYDTGQSDILLHNLKRIGVQPDAIDRVILSHGHYDHSGGLMPLLKTRSRPLPVYVHEDAFIPKVKVVNGEVIHIGMQYSKSEYAANGAQFIYIKEFYRIDDEICSISDINNRKMVLDERLQVLNNSELDTDSFNDDTSLLLSTEAGQVVLLGCAHPGVANILDELERKTWIMDFYAIIGGMHLLHAGTEYIKKSLLRLADFKFKIIAASHCTGSAAIAAMDACCDMHNSPAKTGDQFDFSKKVEV